MIIKKGVVSMAGAIFIFLVIVCLVLMGALFMLYIGERADARNNLFHRCWNSFLCAYLKMDTHISHGADYLKSGHRTTYEEEFGLYYFDEKENSKFYIKHRRLQKKTL